MAVSLAEVMDKFTPAQRARVEARAQELIEQALTRRGLRQAQHLTQERMAALLGVAQENVSRLERRADLLLSTLSSSVAAMRPPPVFSRPAACRSHCQPPGRWKMPFEFPILSRPVTCW